MGLWDTKLRNINDENRRDVLNSLTDEELDNALADDWNEIFKNIYLQVKKDKEKLPEFRLNREMMRKIYPHYPRSKATNSIKEQDDAKNLFDFLSKNPLFNHIAYRWDQTPDEEKARLLEPLITVVAQKMKLNLSRLETFKENNDTLAYVIPGQNVLHLNTHPAVFKGRAFASATGTLYHELTHMEQREKMDSLLNKVAAEEFVFESNNYSVSRYFAPYFSEDRGKTISGYDFDSFRDRQAYKGHPKEKEAYSRGNFLRTFVEQAVKNGLGKNLIPNPYDEDEERKNYNPKNEPGLDIANYDTNPYHHLIYAEKLLDCLKNKKTIYNTILYDRQTEEMYLSDATKHLDACIRLSEFMVKTPAIKAFHLLSNAGLKRKDQLKFRCTQTIENVFNKYTKSKNPVIASFASSFLKAREAIMERLEKTPPPPKVPKDQAPLNKQNKIDIQDAYGKKDEKTEQNSKAKEEQLRKEKEEALRRQKDEEIRRKTEELRRQLTINKGLSI